VAGAGPATAPTRGLLRGRSNARFVRGGRAV